MRNSTAARYQCCSPNCTNTVETAGWCETCWPCDPWEGTLDHAQNKPQLVPQAARVPTRLELPDARDIERMTDHDYKKVPVRL